MSFTECHFDSWDHHLNLNGTAYEHHGSAAVEQHGGTLILSGNEFRQPGLQTRLQGGLGTKTIVTENIIKGKLHVENHVIGGKAIIKNNADDSPASEDEL